MEALLLVLFPICIPTNVRAGVFALTAAIWSVGEFQTALLDVRLDDFLDLQRSGADEKEPREGAPDHA